MKSLAHRKPYKISFNDIRVKFDKEVPFSQAMYALNATVVGLVIDSTRYHTKSTGGFVPPHTPLVQNCVGLGLIRGIDISNQCFYIITPVPLEVLQNVGLLVRGGHEFPVAMLGKGPYTTTAEPEGVGATATRNRHLGRRRLVD